MIIKTITLANLAAILDEAEDEALYAYGLN